MKNLKAIKFINSVGVKVIAGVISGIIVILASPTIVSLRDNISFIDAIIKIIKLLGSLLLVKIPIWLVLIILLIIILLYIFIIKVDINKEPDWHYYTQDNIKHWRVCWEYDADYKHIYRLRVLCPDCSCDLMEVPHGLSSEYLCPNCALHHPEIPYLDDLNKNAVEKIIIHRIKTSEYLKSPYF